MYDLLLKLIYGLFFVLLSGGRKCKMHDCFSILASYLPIKFCTKRSYLEVNRLKNSKFENCARLGSGFNLQVH